MNILVVDDSLLQRRFVCRVLDKRSDKYQIIEANDGLEAIEAIKTGNKFDLIITDYNMPKMNGLEMIKTIRADQDLPEIPIIIISAEVSKVNMLEAIEAGANMEILKPFTENDLNKSIDYVMDIEDIDNSETELEELKKRIRDLEIENEALKKKLEKAP